MYQELFKIAQNVALQKQSSGQATPSDTVCVIQAVSKRCYTGVSHAEMQNGVMVGVHAEIDAVQQMRNGGDTIAEFILLIGVMTLQPILPCSGCVSFILGQAPENANCQVVLPDRMITLPQIGQMPGNSMPFNGAMPAGNSPYGHPGAVSMYSNANPGAVSMYNNANPGAVSMYSNAMPYGNSMYGQSYGGPAGVSMYNNAIPYSGNPGVSGQYASNMSGMVYRKKSNGSKLKGKISNLVNAGEDIGKDEEPENELFSKLFRK